MPRNEHLPAAATGLPRPTRDQLIQYAEWLFMEYRLLMLELCPDALEPGSVEKGQPSLQPEFRTPISGDFHFPKDGRTWRDVLPPSARCLAVLQAIGLAETGDAE